MIFMTFQSIVEVPSGTFPGSTSIPSMKERTPGLWTRQREWTAYHAGLKEFD